MNLKLQLFVSFVFVGNFLMYVTWLKKRLGITAIPCFENYLLRTLDFTVDSMEYQLQTWSVADFVVFKLQPSFFRPILRRSSFIYPLSLPGYTQSHVQSMLV